ncbi:hypothetical protein LDENG_00233600 [Lucifuga dentata]|nr:hypothetical protein LDENG_00233600 [Lucifuga dentata]
MEQQEEPLYDFPEPTQPSQNKFAGHQRGQGSLRSVSVLDRLLLTIPVWLQLSINPATALHILQREPPGTFLVRKSRTSRRNVLCVRLADDSVPSFVQQFGIREEHSTFSLETSAISFPDLPRLISFYCVSRDVLPFPLELPEAIAKATSHKELESISHMGVEFWNSHLNVRGPREMPKAQKDEDKPENVTSVPSDAALQTISTMQTDSAPEPDKANQLATKPQSDTAANQSEHNPTLFQEFCPIRTRSPRELDYGSGLGALCFINPLFLQSQSALSRQRLLKRSLKVRVSMETSTLLSPPLAPPPPPPLMPKTKSRRKVKMQTQGQAVAQPREVPDLSLDQSPANPKQPCLTDPTAHYNQLKPVTQTKNIQLHPEDSNTEAQEQLPCQLPHVQPQMQEQDQIQGQTHTEPGQTRTGQGEKEAGTQLQIPSSTTLMEHLPDDSDYMQPSVKLPPSLSPFTSSSFSQLTVEEYHTPTICVRPDQERKGEDADERDSEVDLQEEDEDETEEDQPEDREEEEIFLLLQQMYGASLNDRGSCSSLSSIEEAEENLPPSPPLIHNNSTSQ